MKIKEDVPSSPYGLCGRKATLNTRGKKKKKKKKKNENQSSGAVSKLR